MECHLRVFERCSTLHLGVRVDVFFHTLKHSGKLAEVETRAERSLVCVHHWSLDTETFSKTATEMFKHEHHEILVVCEVVHDGSLIFMIYLCICIYSIWYTVYEMIWHIYTYDITWYNMIYIHNIYIYIYIHTTFTYTYMFVAVA